MESAVATKFKKDSHMSLRRATNRFSISMDSVRGILQDHSFHPYKMQTVQQLSEEDPDHLLNLFFSDEAHFHLHGSVNWHNFRY